MRSGRASLSSHCTARLTQSVGVPSTAYTRSSSFWSRSGRVRVSEWPEALCSRSGATMMTSPSSRRAPARSLMPSEYTPSSLVTRMRVMVSDGPRHCIWPGRRCLARHNYRPAESCRLRGDLETQSSTHQLARLLEHTGLLACQGDTAVAGSVQEREDALTTVPCSNAVLLVQPRQLARPSTVSGIEVDPVRIQPQIQAAGPEPPPPLVSPSEAFEHRS